MDKRKPAEIFRILFQNLDKEPYFQQQEVIEKFQSQNTNRDRVSFLHELLLQNCPNFPKFTKDDKSDAKALELRQHGNQLMDRGKFQEALEAYTRSVSFAESSSALGKAYGKRSAALYKLHLYKEGLKDIETALAIGYDGIKSVLLKRRSECEAKRAQQINKQCEPLPKFPKSEKNPAIDCARNCIKIMTNQEHGRHVVATRDIEIGEIIAIEEPYAATIDLDVIYFHCHECLRLCYNLIPCNGCTKTLYCSERCKSKAATYHKYECPILLSLDSLSLDIYNRLALKLLFQFENDINGNPLDGSNRFKEIYELETRSDRDCSALFALAAVAAALFDLIKNHTSFIRNGISEDIVKESLFTLLMITGINSKKITEVLTQYEDYDINGFGSAIYPFCSLFNHSCWPNLIQTYHGTTMVLRALNTIKKGQQCFISYGPFYWNYRKDFRHYFLQKYYFFTCSCPACLENWPVISFTDLKNFGFHMEFARLRLESGNNVQAAKEELAGILVEAKDVEKRMPPGLDVEIKQLLINCYRIFGNKRRM